MNNLKLIENVIVKPLKKVTNNKGGLLEIQRNDDDIYPGFGQSYITTTFPGIIKAWYRHFNQIDQIIPLQGLMKLVLYDTQPNSTTKHTINEFIVSIDNPMLIQIPPYVWHGFKALDTQNLMIMHLNNHAYQDDHLDEERVNFDDKGIPYQW